jgi:hypothetical protein
MNAWDVTALRAISQDLLPSLSEKSAVLASYIKDSEEDQELVNEKMSALWKNQKLLLDNVIDVMKDADKDDDELEVDGKTRREAYFKDAQNLWEVRIKMALLKLNEEMVGPFVLGAVTCYFGMRLEDLTRTLIGDQLCLADLHVGAWLAYVVKLCSGSVDKDGKAALGEVGERIGWEEKESKLIIFWDAMKSRESWIQVYS